MKYVYLAYYDNGLIYEDQEITLIGVYDNEYDSLLAAVEYQTEQKEKYPNWTSRSDIYSKRIELNRRIE